MKKSFIAILAVAVLSIGLFGGFTYAQGRNAAQASNNNTPAAASNETQNSANYSNMINIMKENGFQKQAEYMQSGNYQAMDNYMNNISDADYNKMIDIMKSNGYGQMADEMQSIGKDNMIKQHNAAGGAAGMMAGLNR